MIVEQDLFTPLLKPNNFKPYFTDYKNQIVRFVDLFAGLGGLRLGFEQALFSIGLKSQCVLSSEIKKSALQAYINHFKETPQGDVTQINTNAIPNFDILLAGFPCQPFSSAGKRRGLDDTRGTLFFEIMRFLLAKKPKGFLLENVPGLLVHDKGKTFSIMLDHLKECGYFVNYKLLNAKDFGVAQNRERLYIVGSLSCPIDLNNFPTTKCVFKDVQEHHLELLNTPFTKKILSQFTPNELYGKAIKDKRGASNNIHSWDLELRGAVNQTQKDFLNLFLKERRKSKYAILWGTPKKDGVPLSLKSIQDFFNHTDLINLLDDLVAKGYLKQIKNPKNNELGFALSGGKLSFEFSKILHPNEPTPTLVASDMHKMGVIDFKNKKVGLRRLSVQEGLRLFGFPKNYSLNTPYKENMDLLGNSVCVPVIQAISKRLIRII
ncbi:DNA (cytosine-5-)-methyltransferase [Helicobacter pylori]|nr:DNA (cytosine-5-)-methyltransferase [Helicobacter pylori]